MPSFLFFPPSHPFLAAALRALAAPGGRGAVASLRLRRDGRGARVGLCISETGLRRGRGASASPPRLDDSGVEHDDVVRRADEDGAVDLVGIDELAEDSAILVDGRRLQRAVGFLR